MAFPRCRTAEVDIFHHALGSKTGGAALANAVGTLVPVRWLPRFCFQRSID